MTRLDPVYGYLEALHRHFEHWQTRHVHPHPQSFPCRCTMREYVIDVERAALRLAYPNDPLRAVFDGTEN